MLTVDNINFRGNFRYMGGSIHSLEFVPIFELGKDNVSKELVEFTKNSKFLNKLKEDRDVFIHHHQELFENKEKSIKPKNIFARLFSKNKTKEQDSAVIGKDHLSVICETTKAKDVENTELCEISITLPIKKDTPLNLNRFEYVLDNFSGIKELREKAEKLFPENSHKLTLLPYNEGKGWCEFWVGEKNPLDTLDRLEIAILEQLKDSAEKTLRGIKK